ncbi:hypothetical protein A3K63_03800 [Candidatus Micrarchaeota archaeon RBG_16_49_10]|nr:MAG: hypothetical protein A3K63_03800 [Candidatus Micrarchaeota archaeon RBG_16_49_10]
MKGLALESIAYMILALVSIALIIMIVTGRLGPAAKSAYCNFLKGLKSLLPLPAHMRTSMPAYCTQEVAGIEPVVINSRDSAAISRDLAAYIAACWAKTGKVNMGKDFLCYEVTIKYVDSQVTEDSVLQVLVDEGFPNFPLLWLAGNIDSPKVLSVGYEADIQRIVVQ